MTTQVALLNESSFAEMAKAVGMTADMARGEKAKSSVLPRLRIWNQATMSEVEVNGKKKKMEVVPEGMYRLQLPDDKYVFAESVEIRTFVQRFMYKRYDSANNSYIKTLMADNLNIDLKDNTGGVNCGKPAGYIQDFNALPQELKDLIKQIKRVRVLLGEVKLNNPIDIGGNEIESEIYPFIWEVDNKDAFKTLGLPFTSLGKQKRLPIQHWIHCGTEQRSLPTGANFYLPTAELNMKDQIDLTEKDQETFSSFMEWINNYNDYILTTWNDKRKEMSSEEDELLVEEFIGIDVDED